MRVHGVHGDNLVVATMAQQSITWEHILEVSPGPAQAILLNHTLFFASSHSSFAIFYLFVPVSTLI